MTRIFLSLLILMFTFGIISDVQAKRFGGGRSFGVSRTTNSFSRSNVVSPSQKAAPNVNRWLGPLAGLAAGGLLSYLLMGHGLGSGIVSWLLIAGAMFLLLNFLRERMRLNPQSNGFHANTNQNSFSSFTTNQPYQQTAAYPAEFDAHHFLRDAKVLFLRMQTAYDNKNLNDIREFSTPEVFAEIQLQLQERGEVINQTEVVSLDVELLEAKKEFSTQLASVTFSGLIKEDPAHAPTSFKEIWHFQQPENQSRWLVAGVQQQTH